MGCSPCGRTESDTTERLHFHFALSCIGEGNGNSLQRSYLENPRDGGACWAAVYGVSQSRTQLKRQQQQQECVCNFMIMGKGVEGCILVFNIDYLERVRAGCTGSDQGEVKCKV